MSDQDNVLFENKSQFMTTSGIELKESYGDGLKPGEFPFTRGPYKTMYRQKPWTMRQYSGFGSAKETNQRFHYLLRQGQTGLSCAFDLPTQMGYDSDHPMAEGEVGRVGVAISTLEDMELLLSKIPLNKVSTSMTINSTAATLLGFYAVVAKKRKVDWKLLRGTIQNDILKEYVARGTFIYPVDFSMNLVSDTFRFCHSHIPGWNPISISGYHMREAGSTAAQEIAFTLSHAFAYVDRALKLGLSLDQFVSRLSFFFNVHNDFFEEVAKFRVARKIYAEEMVKRFNAPSSRLGLKFHAQTAGSTLTAQQPLNNAIRVSYQAMAAVLGGAQSLHTNSFDEALSLPTEQSALLALRTQQILAEETGVIRVGDPLAGSYFLESLCSELESKALAIIRRIDEMGGALKAIDNHFTQNEIQRAAFDAQKKIDDKDQIVVGVNSYQQESQSSHKLHHLDPRIAKDQLKRLKAFKAKRKVKVIHTALKKLETQAVELLANRQANACEAIIAAIEAKCTLGEIADVFRGVAGVYKG